MGDEVNIGGRPTDYKPEFNDQVYKLCLLGATDKEIADFFEIAESTLNLWKKEKSGFSESIRAGKINADAEVAKSLYKRATGYQYDEITYEKVGEGQTLTEVAETGLESVKSDLYKKKVVTKEVAPDVAAQNIWLKNRRGRVTADAQRWADKVETGFTNSDGKDIQPAIIFQPAPNCTPIDPDNTVTE